MKDFSNKLESLTPEKRKLFELYLKNKRFEKIAGFSSIQPIMEPFPPLEEFYPSSSAQKRLFLINQIESANTVYNIPVVMLVEGNIDRERFKKSFQELVNRHESLRTSFELMDGELVQKIHQNVELTISYFEIKEDKATACTRVDEILRNFVQPFDLSKAPLLRVGLIKLMDWEEHILVYDMHHIISDGASMRIILNELPLLYYGEALPDLRIQYKDFAAWQNELLSSPAIKEQEKYWLNVFGAIGSTGEIPLLDMPTDYPRPSIRSFEGDCITFTAGNTITNGLEAIAAKSGATMYMVILAAFNVILAKYSGQEDIVVGTPIAGRHHTDLENIIGMFVNTLVMRNYPKGNKTFTEFLNEVKENSLKGYENQDYQFEKLVEKLDIRRDMSRNPLFDVMFVLQNTNTRARTEKIGIGIEGLRFKPYEFNNSISKFDITLNAFEVEEFTKETDITHVARNIHFDLEYCTKLFKKESMERLIGHFINILNEIVANPGKQLSEIEILSIEEKKHILFDFNNTAVAYQKDKTAHQLFEEYVIKSPDNTAIVDGDKKLTYGELNSKANQLAGYLRSQGVGRNSIVGIMAERSLEMIVGILGVLKAGGAYLPLDPEYPDERIAYMLEDSNAEKVLIQGRYIDKPFIKERIGSLNSGRHSVVINLEDESLFTGDLNNLNNINMPEDLVYIIYTSGSTGKPKGVMVEHKGLSNLKIYFSEVLKVNETDRIVQFANNSFDASVWEIFMTFLNGASLFMISRDEINDIFRFEEYLNTKGITIATLPPTYLPNLNPDRIKTLRKIITAGSTTPVALIKKWSSKFEHINDYGPTETTICATAWENNAHMRAGDKAEYNSVPIGKPIPNIRIYILDGNNQLKPLNVAGELCIAGDGLGRGYLNRPELSNDKFVPDPFNPGAKMYRSGDLARWLSDGNIEFLGRIDYQVKIRGFRIEPGEIESELLKHENIKEAVVIDKEDKSGNKYLCAYIVITREREHGDPPENNLNVQELRIHLLKKLPEYMIPSYFIKLAKLPLTSNGKIDRKSLPEPDSNIDTGYEYEAPSSEIETVLAEIWQNILGVEKIGVNDDFFTLGGNSIIAIQVATKAQSQNIGLHIKDIMQYRNIKTIVENADLKNKSAKESVPKKEIVDLWQEILEEADTESFSKNQGERNNKGLNDYLLSTLAQSYAPVTFSGQRPNIINRFLVKGINRNEKKFNLEPAVNNGITLTLPDSASGYTNKELESHWRYFISRKESDLFQSVDPYDLFDKGTDKYLYFLNGLYCSAETEALVSIWGFNPIRVWINGSLSRTSSISYNIMTNLFVFKFKKGLNTILFERMSFPSNQKKLGIIERENVITIKPVEFFTSSAEKEFFDEGLFEELRSSYMIIPETALFKDGKIKFTVLPNWVDATENEKIQIEIKNVKGELLKNFTAYTGEEIRLEIDGVTGVLVINAKGVQNPKKSLDTYIFIGDFIKERDLLVQKADSILGREHPALKMIRKLVKVPDICYETAEMAQEELFEPMLKNYAEFDNAVTRALLSGEDFQNLEIFDIFKNSAMFFEESEIDGGDIAYRVYLPKNYQKAGSQTDGGSGYPLVLALAWGYAMSNIPRAPRYLLRGEFDEAIVVTICARGELNADFINETGYLKIIDTMMQNFNIDRERIYSVALCTAAIKVFGLAIRKPDLFSGFVNIGSMPRIMDIEYLRNIENLTVYNMFSFDDAVHTAMISENILINREKVKNYFYNYYTHGEFSFFFNSRSLLQSLVNKKREKYPKKLCFNTQEPVFNKSYWIYIDRIADLNFKAKIEAEIISTDEIRIIGSNIKTFTLLLGQNEMNLDKNVNIQVNGIVSQIEIAEYSRITIINTNQEYSFKIRTLDKEEFHKQYEDITVKEELLGLKQVYQKKCIILKPDNINHNNDKIQNLLFEILQSPLKERVRNYRYEMWQESVIDETKLSHSNFVIFISPSAQDALREKVLKFSGLVLEQNKIIYHDHQFSCTHPHTDYFALIKDRNPFNLEKLALLVTYNTQSAGEGLIKFLNSFDNNPLFYSDLIIYNNGEFHSIRQEF